MKLTLTAKHPETHDVTSFIFTPEQPVTWIAGQYITLTVPHENPDSHGIEHYFTVSSAPYEGVIQITTRLTGSTFKHALDALPLGSVLNAVEPEGDFTLENPAGEYVFVAGGIGITPFHSILKQLQHEQKPLKALLLYANRTPEAIFKEELEAMAATNPDFRIQYVIDPERLDEQSMRTYVLDLTTPMFYISGPEPMVESLEKTFQEKLGIPEARMHRDYFPGYDQKNF